MQHSGVSVASGSSVAGGNSGGRATGIRRPSLRPKKQQLTIARLRWKFYARTVVGNKELHNVLLALALKPRDHQLLRTARAMCDEDTKTLLGNVVPLMVSSRLEQLDGIDAHTAKHNLFVVVVALVREMDFYQQEKPRARCWMYWTRILEKLMYDEEDDDRGPQDKVMTTVTLDEQDEVPVLKIFAALIPVIHPYLILGHESVLSVNMLELLGVLAQDKYRKQVMVRYQLHATLIRILLKEGQEWTMAESGSAGPANGHTRNGSMESQVTDEMSAEALGTSIELPTMNIDLSGVWLEDEKHHLEQKLDLCCTPAQGSASKILSMLCSEDEVQVMLMNMQAYQVLGKMARPPVYTAANENKPYPEEPVKRARRKAATSNEYTSTMDYGEGEHYEGQMQSGKWHGHGVYHNGSGETYTGNFYCGIKEGTGELRLTCGDRYVGSFCGNRFHGMGTYYWARTTSGRRYSTVRYWGEWRHGKPHGRGMYIEEDEDVSGDEGNDESGVPRVTLTGDWEVWESTLHIISRVCVAPEGQSFFAKDKALVHSIVTALPYIPQSVASCALGVLFQIAPAITYYDELLTDGHNIISMLKNMIISLEHHWGENRRLAMEVLDRMVRHPQCADVAFQAGIMRILTPYLDVLEPERIVPQWATDDYVSPQDEHNARLFVDFGVEKETRNPLQIEEDEAKARALTRLKERKRGLIEWDRCGEEDEMLSNPKWQYDNRWVKVLLSEKMRVKARTQSYLETLDVEIPQVIAKVTRQRLKFEAATSIIGMRYHSRDTRGHKLRSEDKYQSLKIRPRPPLPIDDEIPACISVLKTICTLVAHDEKKRRYFVDSHLFRRLIHPMTSQWDEIHGNAARLIRILVREDIYARKQITEAGFVMPLIMLLKSPNPFAKQMAAESLHHLAAELPNSDATRQLLAGEGIVDILRLLSSPDSRVQGEAIKVLVDVCLRDDAYGTIHAAAQNRATVEEDETARIASPCAE